MEPTGKIPPQPWMTAPETRTLMQALREADIEARFIGGCVRDSILNRPVKDIDIATPVPPEQVMAVLEKAGIRTIPTGIDHGTITAIVDKHHFEITTLRIDVKTDGRRAQVAFTDDWTADAARRDFTINAMSANEDGDVFDPYNGMEDLGQGRVRFVGDALQRINEDVLRLLRFFRFFAEYAKPPINAEALIACRKMAHRLSELSGERVRGEIFRILMAPNTADTLAMMRAEKVLEHILPEAGDVARLRALAWLLERGIRMDELETDPVRRMAALMAPDCVLRDANTVAERLKFSNFERRHLEQLVAPPPTGVKQPISSQWSDKQVRRACFHLGPAVLIDLALLAWAGEIAETPRQKTPVIEGWERVLKSIIACPTQEFPLKGRDGLKLGIAAGPELGRALKQVEQWWIEGDFQAGRENCLKRLKAAFEG